MADRASHTSPARIRRRRAGSPPSRARGTRNPRHRRASRATSDHLASLPMVIAIDGPAGAGKSTVARAVAAELGFTYLDSGAMYRCVALAAMEAGLDLDDGEALGELAEGLEIGFDGRSVLLGHRDVSAEVRTPEVTAAASRVSVHPRVREAMVARQRQLIETGNYVAEGRDIGTVVSPEAPLK